MTDETKQEVVPQPEPGALSPAQVALLQQHAGKQKFTVREMTVPQLKLVQTAGGYMKKSSSDYIKDAEEGQFTKAVATEKEAIALETDGKEKEDFTARLKLYESYTPYRNRRFQ